MGGRQERLPRVGLPRRRRGLHRARPRLRRQIATRAPRAGHRRVRAQRLHVISHVVVRHVVVRHVVVVRQVMCLSAAEPCSCGVGLRSGAESCSRGTGLRSGADHTARDTSRRGGDETVDETQHEDHGAQREP